MTVPLGNPYALGAGPTVPTSARTDRLAMGASFRPSAAALGATSGFLYGPAGTMGDLTLLTDVLLRVDPFLAVIQGTHASNQGQYIVPNDTTRDLAVPAKDASLFRRALVVVRVADSLAAGVATSATTDGSWLEIVSGPLAAANPQLPATPANALLAGELSIPSTASGLPVTITKYNPRTTSRGGIMPVLATDTVAPLFDEQYRSHPVYGLQRALGGSWRTVGGIAPVLVGDVVAPAYDGQYRDHPTYGLQRGSGGAWGPAELQRPLIHVEGGTGVAQASAAVAQFITGQSIIRGRGLFYDNVTGRITPAGPSSYGTYLISAGVQISANATGRRFVIIYKNGVALAAAQAGVVSAGAAQTFPLTSCTYQVELGAGDYLNYAGYQDSGVALTINRGACFLQATYLGGLS